MVPPGVVSLFSVAEAVAGDGAVPVLHCPVQEELAGAHSHHLVDPEKWAMNMSPFFYWRRDVKESARIVVAYRPVLWIRIRIRIYIRIRIILVTWIRIRIRIRIK